METPLIIFALTYFVLAIGRVPGFRVDRTGAAIIGATAMIAFRVLSLKDAWLAIDFNTIALLFGMMVVVANLRLSGFFGLVSAWVVEHAHRPIVLLACIVLVSGAFSAFFVNDAVCLALTPIVLDVVTALGVNPIPYLLALAMASNAGSVATITGNPQNMMIGSFSGIPYRQFFAALSPVAAISLVLTVAVICLLYPSEFRAGKRFTTKPPQVRLVRGVMWKSLLIAIGIIAALFFGFPPPEVALAGGAILLFTRRLKPERVYAEIDWSLLALFAGLFIVIAGVEKAPLFERLPELTANLGLDRLAVLSFFSAVLSNIVSNVPAVLVFRPFMAHLANPTRGWLALAMSSTLAGNLTILGSVANLIVLQRARHKVKIGFWEYFRAGAPLTILTIGLGILVL